MQTPTCRRDDGPAWRRLGRATPGARGKRSIIARFGFRSSCTGGPNAISAFLGALGRDFPLPILVIQHMPPVFTDLLAQRFRSELGRPCAEGRDGEPIVAGRLYVAPGGRHIIVERHGTEAILRLHDGAPENFCRPAADPLLRSVAEHFGGSAITVVLTGMGEDGRRGAEALAGAGAPVLVQDERSSVVWGMPGAIARAGLATAVLPPDHLGAEVARMVRSKEHGR
jgi:two-component system chemotaxis response regulator CheB